MRNSLPCLKQFIFLFAMVGVVLPLAAQTGSNSDTTTVTATPSSVTVDTPVTINAAVSGAAGGPAPTGSIQFLIGTAVLDTLTVVNSRAAITEPTKGIAPGTYSLVASYSGDDFYAPSKSSPLEVTITAFETATTLNITPLPVDEGKNVRLTVGVGEVGGSNVPTGSVTFYVHGAAISTAPLSHGALSIVTSTAGYPSGTYTVTAKYSGDTDNAASTSAPVTANIVGTTATTLAFGRGTYAVGQTVQMTATVTAPSGGGTPAGTVKFAVGAKVFGSAALANGAATLQAATAGLPTGNYPVTAMYEGSSAFQPSSGTATLTLATGYTISPASVALLPSGTAQFTISPTPTGTVTWYVEGVPGGNETFGTIDANGNFTAPDETIVASRQAITASVSTEPNYITPPVYSYVDIPGTVATTANNQVAAYSINIPDGASAMVNFGTTTAYGLNTWSLPAPDGGGNVTILVAGMLAATEYHMQAVVSLPGGLTFTDADHTFTTGSPANPPTVSMVTTGTPQPGVEFLDRYEPPAAYVYDLAGNLLWSYTATAYPLLSAGFQPFKPLPDGNFLINVAPDSAYPIDGSIIAANTPIDIREVNLTNATVRDLDLATLQNNLNQFGYVNALGNQIELLNMHHDVTVNPTNGHWLVISNTEEVLDNLVGYSSPETVLGDVVIDVDPANGFAVDWVWNEFDHLDVNRHPMNFPDWTHTNAIVYSKDDGNILVSMRHQNWIVKVDYQNGTGSGNVIWHLGYQGDFTLVGGTSPIDWQYAQHGPSFTTANTTGVFGLGVMDNGNDRMFGSSPCPITASPCLYSRAPIFTVDETAMTATLSNAAIGPGYSDYGGNAEILANGDYEADYCAIGANAVIQETTLGDSPQTVWQANVTGSDIYRGFRVGSFYPGITWSADALKFQVDHAVHVKKQKLAEAH